MSNDIESQDIIERLVGITPIYLNNFLQRNLYGLKASVQTGKVRKERRLFNREDVFGIALVWLLFESGLRGDPIARILNDVAGTKKANANLAARKLLESGADYLAVVRKPRGPAKTWADKPEQVVKMIRQSELAPLIEQSVGADLVIIPVGSKFEDIEKRMEILF